MRSCAWSLGLLAAIVGLVSGIAQAEGESEDERVGAELIAARAEALEVPPVEAGASSELSLVLLETPDRDLPLLVRLDGGELELAEDRLDGRAIVDPLAVQPRLRTSFVAPTQLGRYEVSATIDYSVCEGRWCRRKHGELRWAIEVRERRQATNPSHES